ncbi:MAG: vanomycin resistance protein VanB [Cellulomonadaceae bacterium]|nr:vanomycin resistance protein VanB [Cellulomonadaceae bacterium]
MSAPGALPGIAPTPEPDGVAPDQGSPIDVFPEERRRRRWPRVLGATASVLVVLGGAYVGALWFLADVVPTGTVVAGVEIGGMHAEDAVAALDSSLATASTEAIAVEAGDKRTSLDPVAAGLRLDTEATVDEVTGFGLEPIRLWNHLFGGGEVAPVTDVDAAALEAVVGDVADSLRTDPVDGTIVYVDGAAVSTAAVDGVAVDEEGAREALTAGWLTDPRPIALPTTVVEPEIGDEEVDRALVTIARPLVDAPIAVSIADQLAELPTSVLAQAATFVPDGGTLDLNLDGAMLVEAVTSRTTNLLTAPADASFTFTDGVPVIVPGAAGTTIDPDTLAAAVEGAATAQDRTARVQLTATDPAQSTAALEALGVTQVVSEFSTPLNSEPRRTVNIINGASKINGTLVRPGETFSLTDALGPIDAAHGYVEAGAIISGEHTDAWGGGLSQVSTTTYNAAYLAGFEDVEHHPHSEWFSRYPEGREATIFTGVFDLRWKNNTPYGALVQAYVEAGRVHVKIWSTPYFTVESSTSGRSGVVQPTTVYSQSPTCEAQSAGNPGFTVTVTRRVLLQGVEQETRSWTVRYKAQNHVVCGAAPAG